MPERPSGTVTFLFSDVEGSTALLGEVGPDAYAAELALHRAALRSAWKSNEGVEIDTQGDSFFYAFARARDAVAAAVDVQRAHTEHTWPAGERVRVRIGLHTGEPAVGSEGYVGIDVVRAARLAATGRGGSVLLSETTRALLGSSLPDGVSVHALGERRLKDIDEPERIYELEIEGAEQAEVPASTKTELDDPWEGHFGDLGKRLSRKIKQDVYSQLQRELDMESLD